jgi:hypothetical protein
VIDQADTTKMTGEELARFRAVGVAVRNLHSRMTSAEKRLADLEDTVAELINPPRKVISGEVDKS